MAMTENGWGKERKINGRAGYGKSGERWVERA
jgi:hypothetical protein